MTKVQRFLEVAGNVAILAAALMLCGQMLSRYYFEVPRREERSRRTADTLRPGTRLSLAGVNWGSSVQTLVFALREGCRFCTESSSFYQRLSRQVADRPEVRLIAILPQTPQAGRRYIDSLGLRADTILQVELPSIGIPGTPTILLVNTDGIIADAWVGKLAPSEEDIYIFIYSALG